MEEYITVRELCKRIGYKEQTIYNKIFKKEFIFSEHYLKPSSKKLLFKWSMMLQWIGDTEFVPTPKQHDLEISDKAVEKKSNKNNNVEGLKIFV